MRKAAATPVLRVPCHHPVLPTCLLPPPSPTYVSLMQAWVQNMQLVVSLKVGGLCSRVTLPSRFDKFCVYHTPVSLLQPRRLLRPPATARYAWFNKLRHKAFYVLTRPNFEMIVAWIVVANIVVMCTKHANPTHHFTTLLDAANFAFTAIFVLEAALRMLALGFRQYFSIFWNSFDFALVLGSIVSAAAGLSSIGVMLRVFRALRVFRLIRSSMQLKQLLSALLF